MMKCNQFFHILRFLQQQELTRQYYNKYERLWKIRSFFDVLNDTYGKFYNPSTYLTEEKVTVLFKGTVIFKQIHSHETNTLEQIFTNFVR